MTGMAIIGLVIIVGINTPNAYAGSKSSYPILPEKVLGRPKGDFNDMNPSWLVREGRHELMYSSNRSGQGAFQIWRSKIGASGYTQVTAAHQESMDLFPITAPGGRSIMFVSNRLGADNLWSIPLKGALVTRITNFSTGKIAHPTISRNDALIAFARCSEAECGDPEEPGNYSIWTMSATGQDMQQLYPGTMPKISPDGKQILYVGRSGEHDSIWRIGVDGTNNTQITTGSSNDNFPDWIDNNRIIFTSDRTDNEDLWMLDLRNQSQIQLTNNIADDKAPAVSPDGKLVAYMSNRGSKKDREIWSIYWMDLEPILQTGSKAKSDE